MDIRITTVQAFPAEGGVVPAAKLITRSCVLPLSPGALSTLTPTLSGARRLTRLAIGCLLVLAVLLCLPSEAAAQRPAFFGYWGDQGTGGICTGVNAANTNLVWLKYESGVSDQTQGSGHYKIIDDILTAFNCTKSKQVIVDVMPELFGDEHGTNLLGHFWFSKDHWVPNSDPRTARTDTAKHAAVEDRIEAIHTVLSQLSALTTQVVMLHVYDEPYWNWKNSPDGTTWFEYKADWKTEFEMVTAELQEQFPTTPLWVNFSAKELWISTNTTSPYMYGTVPPGIDYISFDCYGAFNNCETGDGHGTMDFITGWYDEGNVHKIKGLRQLIEDEKNAGRAGMKLIVIPQTFAQLQGDCDVLEHETADQRSNWPMFDAYQAYNGYNVTFATATDVVAFLPYLWGSHCEGTSPDPTFYRWGPDNNTTLRAAFDTPAAVWTNYWVDGGVSERHSTVSAPSNNAVFTDSLQVTGYALDLAFSGQVPWTSGMDYVDIWLEPYYGGNMWYLSCNWMYQGTTYGLDSSYAASQWGEPFRYSAFDVPHTQAMEQVNGNLQNPVALSSIPSTWYWLHVYGRSLVKNTWVELANSPRLIRKQ